MNKYHETKRKRISSNFKVYKPYVYKDILKAYELVDELREKKGSKCLNRKCTKCNNMSFIKFK